MGDEIDVVKEKIVDIARNVSAGQPRPDVRFGIVAFRDRGDAYVTKAFSFSREIADVQKTLRSLTAEGGGDEPEAVAEGLHAAVHELEWDFSKDTARMIFLIGDAGPQQYRDGKDWRKVTSEAAEKGITISVIACSGLSPAGARRRRAQVQRAERGRKDLGRRSRAGRLRMEEGRGGPGEGRQGARGRGST